MRTGVSIIIPTWNGLDLLKRFLPSVIAATTHYVEQSGAGVEIIVADDWSTDSTAAWLEDQGFEGPVNRSARTAQPGAPDLRWIRNESNLGFGATCNRGVAAALHPLVFLLNNDVDVSLESIAPLVENFADVKVFAAHCRVFDLDSGRECGTGKAGGFARGFIRVHQSYKPKFRDGEGEDVRAPDLGSHLYSMFAGGGSAMFDRDKFLELGGFDSLLSPFYWEDVELSYRAWKRGYSVLYEPRSITHHRLSSTIGTLKRGMVRRIEQRNRLAFHWINLHDAKLMRSHVLWVIALAITAPFRLRPGFLLSCFAALKMLRRIRARRSEERRAAVRSDRDVIAIFDELKRRLDLIVYDD